MAGTLDARAKVNAEFGRLLSGAINSIATCEGRTAPIVEQELGQQIGLTVASIQRYKSGRLPPDPRAIRIFAEAGVRRGYLNRRWLAHHVQRMARAGNPAEAEGWLARMQALAAMNALPGDVAEPYHHSLATYHLARGAVDEAEREWRALLAGLAEAPASEAASARLVALKWLATCLRQKGDLTQARQVLSDALSMAGDAAPVRATLSLQLELARVLLEEGHLEATEQLVAECREQVARHAVERHMPDVCFVQGQVLRARGDMAGARRALTEARDGFERIGLRREIDEARAALRQAMG